MSNKDKNPEQPLSSDYGLPRVSKDIAEGMLAEARQDTNSFNKLADERMRVNNPELYDMIGSYAFSLLGSNAPKEAITVVHGVMVMTHEILRRQAEADNLSQAIDLPELPEA